MNSEKRELYPGVWGDGKTAETLVYEPYEPPKTTIIISKLKNLARRFTYWLGWRIAGKRIWDKAVTWAAENIYMASALPRSNETTILPLGITVVDKPLRITSGMELDGQNHILAQPVNKPQPEAVLVPPRTRDAFIHNVRIIGKSKIAAIVGECPPEIKD
ncbi:hypothetical protein ES703_80330 [subsurface metagenome]